MVAANFTLLAALNAKTPAPTAASAQAETEVNINAGRDFAKLVKESSAQAREATPSRVKVRSDISARAEHSNKHSRLDWKKTDREITPREAARILKTIDARAERSDVDPKTIAQVKEKLQAIVDKNEPAKLSDVLAAVTGKDPKELVALFGDASVEADIETLTAIRQVVSLLNKALRSQGGEKNLEAAAEVEEIIPTLSDVTNKTYVEITPMMNEIAVPMNQNPLGVMPLVETSVDAIAAVDVAKQVSVATLVPSLELSADDKKKPLPDVELPKIELASAATAEVAASDAAPAPALPSAIERQLQALNDNRQFFASGLVKDETAAAPKVAANSNVSASAAVQPIAAAGTLTGASAVTAIGNTAGNLLNHATVREQVHVAISKAAKEGIEQITIALEPQGLGRVEVKMHTGRDGLTTLSFLVDKPETFDALARDARGLERALQDTGLKADSGGMQFNLRQQTQADAGDRQPHEQHSALSANAEINVAANVETRNYRVAVRDGIDIHA